MNQTSEKNNGEAGQSAGGSALTLRLLSALVLVPLAVTVVYFGAWPLAGFLGLVGVLMLFEWYRMALSDGAHMAAFAPVFMVSTVSALLCFYFATNSNWLASILTLGIGSLGSLILSLKKAKTQALWVVAALPYIVFPGIIFIWIRAEVDLGLEIIFWMLFVVWATDSGGYIAGRSIGGWKLAPSISPNKTWAGFFGGIVLSILMGVIAAYLIEDASLQVFVILSAVLSVISQLGDLFESAVKRHFGVKDISGFIPGHGGVLDRMDGLLFVLMAVGLFAFLNDGRLLIWP